jgi:hypothetical protein
VFTEKDERIRSGMTVDCENYVVGQKESVVTIPGNYIREDKVKRKFFVDIVDSNDEGKQMKGK